jgi:hypothetical protein
MKKILSILIVSMLAMNVIAANEDAKKESTETSTTMVNTIKGKVVDKSTGEALAGVSVKLDENTIVYTDFDGNFTINLTQPKAKICVSLISYATTEVEVKKSSNQVKIELNAVE